MSVRRAQPSRARPQWLLPRTRAGDPLARAGSYDFI